ncbi:MAG TPA: hypothetical protein VIV61_11130 [Candidatus Ozemobacteraceae bacterium]
MRTTRRDGFRWVLAILFILQASYVYYLVGQAQENLRLVRIYRSATETDRPADGTYVCLTGDVVPFAPQIMDQAFDRDLCDRLGVRDPIWYEARFTHTVKHGKSTHTITDRVLSGRRSYRVRTPAGEVTLDQSPEFTYSYHRTSFGSDDGLLRYSPVSRRLGVEYFAPRRVHVFGVAHVGPNGAISLSGAYKQPVIVSEVSRSTLVSNTMMAVGLTAAAIVYFLTTLFVPWKTSIREQIEKLPSVCYIFDVTGGSEGLAIFFFVLYGVAFGLINAYFGSDHAFYADQLSAVAFMGFCMLVHISRSVEFLYVADKRDGYLYEYSRGYFSFTKTRLAPIADLRLWIDVQRNSKGQKSYYLKAGVPGGKVFDVGGSGSSEATLIDIKNEFDQFRGRRPTGTGLAFSAPAQG